MVVLGGAAVSDERGTPIGLRGKGVPGFRAAERDRLVPEEFYILRQSTESSYSL